ncbi:MAG: uroporphyrinogen-III synthase [Limnohabitans sp.]
MGQAAHPGVMVTRPLEQAQHWVSLLQQAGVQAQALPLIDIAPAPDRASMKQAWHRVPDCVALMFVSANAVEMFMDGQPSGHLAAGVRAWVTGPGTRSALRRRGWPEELIDAPPADAAQFDSEALWSQVATSVKPGEKVMIVRGADSQGVPAGRDWLALTLENAGVQVLVCVADVRQLPVWGLEQRQQTRLALQRGAWWLFGSSEAARNLVTLEPGQSWAGARALATHPRIARCLRDMGWGQVLELAPQRAALIESIKSLA